MKAYWLEQSDKPSISAEELNSQGIHYQALDTNDNAYQPALDALKTQNGYVEQDEVNLAPSTPNLNELCAKFIDEHYHDDDEVRFVLDGAGIFDIRSKEDEWMRVQVEKGDLIVVPAKRYHRFMLTETKTIQCVRLYQDTSGWVPVYRQSSEPTRRIETHARS